MGYLADVQDGNWGLVTQLTHLQGGFACEQEENIPSSCPLSWDTISPPAGEYMELRDPKNFLQPHRTRRFLPHVDYLVNDF